MRRRRIDLLQSLFQRKTAYILGGVLLIYGSVVALKGPQGIQALIEKHHEIRQLEEQNAAMALENQRRKERIQRLENNVSEQEMEIRKQLKLLRPGETTFILPDTPKSSGSNSAEAPPQR